MKNNLVIIFFFVSLMSFGISHSQTLSVDNFSLPALTGAAPYDFQRITFSTPFPSGTIPIVMVTGTSVGSDEPMTLRIFNIDNTGFDVIQTEPSRTPGSSNCGTPVSALTPCDGAHVSINGSYLAVTAGVQTLSDGTIIEAGINNSNTVQHRITGSLIPTGWDTITPSNTFAAAPVILSQIQTMNNENNLTVGSPNQMTGVSSPFMESAVQSVLVGGGFELAIELAEANDGNAFAPIAENLGWVAITNNVTSTITFNGSSTGFATDTFSGIAGFQNGCNANTISAIPGACASPIVLGSMNTRQGNNGGWVRRCSLSTAVSGGGTNVTIGYHIDEDQDLDTERLHIGEAVGTVVFCNPITLPVSIEYVSTKTINNVLTIEWMTSSQTRSLSFEIWGNFSSQMRAIGKTVESQAVNKMTPSLYSIQYTFKKLPDEVYILHNNTDGSKEYFGPYNLNEELGEKYQAKKINWSKLSKKNTKSQKTTDSLALNIHTSGVGIHRVYAYQIPGFIGEDKNAIAVTLSGQPIGRHIGEIANNTSSNVLFTNSFENSNANNALFTSESYIDFYATKPSIDNSLYLKNNTYQLEINGPNAKQNINVQYISGVAAVEQSQIYYSEENNHYDFSSPKTDPWFQQRILRSSSDSSIQIAFEDLNVISNSNFDITIGLYGVTDFPAQDTNNNGEINNDHHLAIFLNQVLIGEQLFDGHIEKDMVINNLSSGLLVNGENEIEIKLINDTGYPFDLINIDSVSIKTISEINANNNLMHLNLFGGFKNTNAQVSHFSSEPTIAYGYQSNELYKLPLQQLATSTYSFSTKEEIKNYWVSTEEFLLPVTVENQQLQNNLAKNINYLVIAHPDFMIENSANSLYNHFNQYLLAKGLHAQWVDVNTIYDSYGHGMKTPKAIQQYIREASLTNSIEYVLFVGGDSYDYHNNLGINSFSHIPSWYVKTNDFIHFTPSDVPYVDFDNDNVPEIAVGRWAVKSIEELTKIINNTVAFETNNVNSILAISENYDVDKQLNYTSQLEGVVSLLPDAEVSNISLDQYMLDHNTISPNSIIQYAKQDMLDQINSGADLIIFSGHGSPTAWTFYGLISPVIAQDITADGDNFYMPLACYTTYFVEPEQHSLAHQLAYGNSNGSAGIVGAITLSQFSHNEIIAKLILGYLNSGKSIGQATLLAKQGLNKEIYKDVILNWSSLVEPSLGFK